MLSFEVSWLCKTASWIQYANTKGGTSEGLWVFFLSKRVVTENTALSLPRNYSSADSFGVREKFLFHNSRELFSAIWTLLWNNYKSKFVVGPRIISHFGGCNTFIILYLFLMLPHHSARFKKKNLKETSDSNSFCACLTASVALHNCFTVALCS